MTVQTIAWHEQCLQNSRSHYEAMEREAAKLQEKIRRMAEDIEFRQKQIDAAKAQGREGFDPDKFMRGKKP
jgi:phage shock protein A